MSLKELSDSLLSAKSEIKITVADKEISFFAHRIGFLRAQEIGKFVGSENKNWLAVLISEAITDSDGAHMTYEQALELPKEVFDQFFTAIVSQNEYLQKRGDGAEEGAEKN